MEFKNILIDCHGTKIRNEPIVIPENMRIISFSSENELTYGKRLVFFKLMCLKDKTFIEKFSHLLSIFGSSLYNMTPAELDKNCEYFGIKYSKDDYKHILGSIKMAGLNKFREQNVKYHGPGTVLSNYSLSFKFYEVLKTVVKIKPSFSINTDGFYNLSGWIGRDKLYYSTSPPNFGVDIVYRLGIADLNDDMKVIPTWDSLVNMLGKITLKNIINSFDVVNKENLITLFVHFCKTDSTQSDTLQQVQQRRIQPLTLLSGIGLQQPKLSFKSPKKSKKIKKSKLGLKK